MSCCFTNHCQFSQGAISLSEDGCFSAPNYCVVTIFIIFIIKLHFSYAFWGILYIYYGNFIHIRNQISSLYWFILVTVLLVPIRGELKPHGVFSRFLCPTRTCLDRTGTWTEYNIINSTFLHRLRCSVYSLEERR
jgi:hypothetical protein